MHYFPRILVLKNWSPTTELVSTVGGQVGASNAWEGRQSTTKMKDDNHVPLHSIHADLGHRLFDD